MVYLGFNNRVANLLKSELTLDFAEKPPWWKLTVKSRVYPSNFIKNGLQVTDLFPLVL